MFMAFGIALGLLILFIGFFLAMFGTPIGWGILFLGFLVIAGIMGMRLMKRSIDAKNQPHPHGPEDRQRGSSDDEMYR